MILVFRSLKFFVHVAFAVSLAACATLDEDKCKDPDWYAVGFEDGSSGFGENRIEKHRSDCAGFNTEPDIDAWRAGRDDGLTHFCSAAGGIAEGSRGRIRSDVCPPELEANFREGYRLGREIFDTNRELDRIEREIRALEARASGSVLDAAIKDNNEARIRALERQYDRLASDLRLLELRADRLSQK